MRQVAKTPRNGQKAKGDFRCLRIRESVNTQIHDFFGGFKGLEVVSKEFAPYQTANLTIILKEYFEKVVPAKKLLGVKNYGYGSDPAADLLEAATFDKLGQFHGTDPTPLVYKRSVSEAIDPRLGIADAVFLLNFAGEKMGVYASTAERRIEAHISISVISRNVEKADRLLSEFCEYEHRNSIFRGRVIRPQINFEDNVVEAEILERRQAAWEEVVLPEEILREIREGIIGYIQSADAMAANGIEVKRGMLFHGVPGTGKSFIASLLASELEGFTTILCSGENLERAAAVFRLARRFAPSLILLEDIDLAGSRREENQSLSVLSTIMNELDGVHQLDRVYALFTTNRIDAIEEALSQRPGRVDVIVEFPLPSRELRARLIRLYAGKADLRLRNPDPILDQTAGTSPAFLKELMKRAVYIAVRNGETSEGGVATVRDAHVERALGELQRIENRAARRIIGFERA